jgi:hypothetical protein
LPRGPFVALSRHWLLAAGDDGLQLRSLPDLHAGPAVPVAAGAIEMLVASPDRTRIAAARRGAVHVFEVEPEKDAR